MKSIISTVGLIAVFATASFAADFSGTLIDATCHDQQQQTPSQSKMQSATPSTSPSTSSSTNPSTNPSMSPSTASSASSSSCNATSATTAFALDVNGKVYKLDSAGNSKAAAAIRNRADRSTDPTKAMSSTYTAKVTGDEKNDTIAVETLDVQ